MKVTPSARIDYTKHASWDLSAGTSSDSCNKQILVLVSLQLQHASHSLLAGRQKMNQLTVCWTCAV